MTIEAMREAVEIAIEMAVEGMAWALVPNVLNLDDGRFEWSAEEQRQLIGALIEVFGEAVATPHTVPTVYTATVKIIDHPDGTSALYVQQPTEGLKQPVFIIAEPDFFEEPQ
jgi:hypothetical protein